MLTFAQMSPCLLVGKAAHTHYMSFWYVLQNKPTFLLSSVLLVYIYMCFRLGGFDEHSLLIKNTCKIS